MRYMVTMSQPRKLPHVAGTDGTDNITVINITSLHDAPVQGIRHPDSTAVSCTVLQTYCHGYIFAQPMNTQCRLMNMRESVHTKQHAATIDANPHGVTCMPRIVADAGRKDNSAQGHVPRYTPRGHSM